MPTSNFQNRFKTQVSGIPQNATAKFTFDATDFNSVNRASVTLIDWNGISITYTIRNDYGATGATEFNAGGSRGAAAENLAQTVESSNGHNGTIQALDSAGVRFTSGGYDFSDGVVVFKQSRQGELGNTEITQADNFNTCAIVPDRFTDGLNAGMSLVMPNVIGRPNHNMKLRIEGTP